ncbi:MAG: hypothetical protein ACRDL9_05150 [Trebonia sp.]
MTESNSTGTIYPGPGSSVIMFNVENTGTGDQQYSTASAAVDSYSGDNPEYSGDIGDITEDSIPVAGCQADWFSASVTSDPAVGNNVAGDSTVHVNVKVTMPTDSADNQDDCEGATPDVTISIS